MHFENRAPSMTPSIIKIAFRKIWVAQNTSISRDKPIYMKAQNGVQSNNKQTAVEFIFIPK